MSDECFFFAVHFLKHKERHIKAYSNTITFEAKEAEYVMVSMKPSLDTELLHCCEPFAEDKSVDYLLSPCQDMVTNLTAELKKETEQCESKHLISSEGQPISLNVYKNLPNFTELSRQSWMPYLQAGLAGLVFVVAFSLIGLVFVLRGMRASQGHELEEHLI